MVLSGVSQQRAISPDPLRPLAARLCTGDDSALHTLHACVSAWLFASALRIVRRHEVADEVVSSTLLQAWRTATTFDPDRATVITWLNTIARSRALDALRCESVRGRHECALDGNEEADAAGDRSQCPRSRLELCQLKRRLASAMFVLSPIQRQVLTMTFLDGDSHEEVALRMRMPLGTVRSHARRALTALRSSSRLRADAA